MSGLTVEILKNLAKQGKVPSGFTQPSLMPIGEVIYDEDC